jgi:imidazolonepropionase-like amidohydrolase
MFLVALLSSSLQATQPPLQYVQTHVPVTIGARDPALHPSGDVIAMSVLGKIWTLPIDGGTASQVTFGIGWDTRPAWSPDGRFLAYAHRSAEGADLVIRTMATGGTRFLHHVSAAIGQIAFSPDGQWVYFINDRSQYDAHLWRIPVAGGDAEQLTHTQNWHEWSFALSPQGDQILLESGRYGGADLYLLDPQERSAARITRTEAREMNVAWSGDGRHRMHVETHNGLDHVVVETAGSFRRIFTSPFSQKQLAPHPDGQTAVMVTGRRLVRLDLETGDTTAIPFRADFTVTQPDAVPLVISNVRLLDVMTGDVTPNSSVAIQDGRIARVRPGGLVNVPAGAQTVDGAGGTLLPGLMDNHYHYWWPFTGSELLASGVTTVRDPGVALADGVDFKDAIRLGILAGPDIYTAGPLIDGAGGYHPMVDVSIEDPAAAASLVRALHNQGADLLKVYFLLEPDVLRAVVDEAHILGLPVTGHIGVRTSWNDAMDAGIDGFNHVRVWRDLLPEDTQPTGENETLDSGRNPLGRMQADWNQIDPDSPEVQALIDRLAASGTAIDPTLFIQQVGDGARPRFSLEEFATAQEGFDRMQRFVKNAVDAGVPLLAGTDNVSLFDELETYADAGISSLEILRAATVNGARWLGQEDAFGTIEPGRLAHLIVVDGDPLEDVSALRDIALVVKHGVVVFRR